MEQSSRKGTWIMVIIALLVVAAVILLVVFIPKANDGTTRRADRLGSLPNDTSNPDSTDAAIQAGRAQVDTVDVMIAESFPVQVFVSASGNLSDGCTTINDVAQRRDGRTFYVDITTARPVDAVCTQALVPWTERIALDAAGLEAGTYTVNVNGTTATFRLAVDNFIDYEIDK